MIVALIHKLHYSEFLVCILILLYLCQYKLVGGLCIWSPWYMVGIWVGWVVVATMVIVPQLLVHLTFSACYQHPPLLHSVHFEWSRKVNLILGLWKDARKLTVFLLKSIAMDSVQAFKAAFLRKLSLRFIIKNSWNQSHFLRRYILQSQCDILQLCNIFNMEEHQWHTFTI